MHRKRQFPSRQAPYTRGIEAKKCGEIVKFEARRHYTGKSLSRGLQACAHLLCEVAATQALTQYHVQLRNLLANGVLVVVQKPAVTSVIQSIW